MSGPFRLSAESAFHFLAAKGAASLNFATARFLVRRFGDASKRNEPHGRWGRHIGWVSHNASSVLPPRPFWFSRQANSSRWKTEGAPGDTPQAPGGLECVRTSE